MRRTAYFVLLILTIASCKQSFEERFAEACPYELRYPVNHHQFEIPIDIIPHKKTYKVGDTMTINFAFSDSIYDQNMQTHFRVKNFPFEPFIILYKFTEDDFEHGYRLNELLVDEKYDHRYLAGSNRGDGSCLLYTSPSPRDRG